MRCCICFIFVCHSLLRKYPLNQNVNKKKLKNNSIEISLKTFSKVHDDAHETIATHQPHQPDQIEVAALLTVHQIVVIIITMENIEHQQHCLKQNRTIRQPTEMAAIQIMIKK